MADLPQFRQGKGKRQDLHVPLRNDSAGFTNAKIILFDLMAYTTFVLPYSNRLSDLLIVTALLEIAGPGANLVYLFAGGKLHNFFNRYPRLIDTVMALLLAACAVYILLS